MKRYLLMGVTCLSVFSILSMEEKCKTFYFWDRLTKEQRQPVGESVELENEATVKQLIKERGKSFFSYMTKDYETPLQVCAAYNFYDSACVLIESGCPVDTMNYGAKSPIGTLTTGRTPLMVACEYGNEQVAQLLIEKGARLDATTKLNQTPLYFGLLNSKLSVTKLLVEMGADLATKHPLDWSSIELAVRNQAEEMVEYLLSKKAQHPGGI